MIRTILKMTWLNPSKGTLVRYTDELEKEKSLAQKDKGLEFKYRFVLLCAFGAVGWEGGFSR